jgi:putative endonuclease
MAQVYYTYILGCEDGARYFGYTSNLKKRLRRHIRGGVFSTRNKQVVLVYYEEFDSRSEAFRREKQLKNGNTRRETIEKLIRDFDKTKCQGFNSQTA